mmetsp:Transcript_18325/g.41819  ORF Transcript_18325/g.41819 Transcript_18325/m.41819 type:complete len:447 (+) Transcript_18325:78-1418(+)
MDFPGRLETIDSSQRDSWNDEIEDFLGKPHLMEPNSNAVEFDDVALQSSLEEVALDLEEQLGASLQNYDTGDPDPNIWSIIRTGKNLLRWFIQIYLDQRQVQRQRSKNQGGCKLDVLRAPKALRCVIQVLNQSVEENKNIKVARDASLYIFYATFSHFPGDQSALTGIDYLIADLAFPKACLEILMKIDSVALALTLVRNVHSMAVSSPAARKSFVGREIFLDPIIATQSAPWADCRSTTVNFFQSLLLLMRWSLDANPPFPSENPEDKRAELVVEILNCFYAMRKGKELVEPTSDVTRKNDSSFLGYSIVRIFQLNLPAISDTDNIISKRINMCQLSAVSLLMDSDVSIGKYLLENGCLETLLELLKGQVDDTVDNTKVDNAATASLVPIMVVLNRYSIANSSFQKKVKAFVFPPETEKDLKIFLEEKRKQKNESVGCTKRNVTR